MVRWEQGRDDDPEACYVGLRCKRARLGQNTTETRVHCDLEICWHQIYRVPVLVFTAYGADDVALSAAQVFEHVRVPDGVTDTAALYGLHPTSVLSSAPHPVTRVAVNMVHPCETANTLTLLKASPDSVHYLDAFLSFTGNLLSLDENVSQPEQRLAQEEVQQTPNDEEADTEDIPQM